MRFHFLNIRKFHIEHLYYLTKLKFAEIYYTVDYEKLFTRALEKKIRMFYEALKWDMPVDKANTLERFF